MFAVFAAGFALGIIGAVRPMVAMALASAVASAALLLMTLGLLRREGLGMSALGLPVSGQRAREFALGFVVSAALFIAVAWTQSAMVGASWAFQGAPGARAALWGLPLAASMVMAEELLFRGAALRYLRQIFGDRSAIVVSAACFGAYHLIGSQHWAMGAVFQFLMPMAGGLLFGWAAVRSGGLALPIGLHLGGNWVQASIAVFTRHLAIQPRRPFTRCGAFQLVRVMHSGCRRPTSSRGCHISPRLRWPRWRSGGSCKQRRQRLPAASPE